MSENTQGGGVVSADEEVMRGKPRRNLQWIAGVLVVAALMGILAYKAGSERARTEQEKEEARAAASHAAPLAKDTGKSSDIAKLIEEQRRSVAVAPAPKPVREADQYDALREAARTAREAPERVALERQRREEQILAAPILATNFATPVSAGATTPGSGRDAGLREIEAQLRARAAAVPGRGDDGGLSALQALAARPAGGDEAGAQAGGNVRWARAQEEDSAGRAVARVAPAVSRFVVHEGTVVPAVLTTRLNSDMPGRIVAMVTQDVFDTIDGRYLLVPKGSRVVGTYNNDVRPGQQRVLIAFSRVIFPNGKSVALRGMPGVDGGGQAGLEGDVDNHFFKMFGAAFLTAAVSSLFSDNSVTVNNFQGGTSATGTAGALALSETTRNVLERNRRIPPTIVVPEGFRFYIMVAHDMALEPYRE